MRNLRVALLTVIRKDLLGSALIVMAISVAHYIRHGSLDAGDAMSAVAAIIFCLVLQVCAELVHLRKN